MERKTRLLILAMCGLVGGMGSLRADGDCVTFSTMLSIDEGTGAKYRKIGLNGFPLPDEKPQQKEESDQEPEETYIDAFNLSLTHQVTDVYVPMQGTDLTLSVRRNWSPEVWSYVSGLRPALPWPDRPFGAGWHSGLTANVHIAAPFNELEVVKDPTYATVTDENGTSYRFLVVYLVSGTSYDEKFLPLPENRNQQETLATSLVTSGTGQLVFTRKYGTKLTFEQSTTVLWEYNLDLSHPETAGTAHQWGRLDKVEDRYGTEVDYNYTGTAATLLPDSISCRGKTIAITSTNGLVTEVVDPRGKTTDYEYADQSIVVASGTYLTLPQTVQGLTSVTRADATTTSYAYSGTWTPDLQPRSVTDPARGNAYFFLDIGSITDPNGKTYSFQYDFDQSRYSFMAEPFYHGWYIPSGNPRNVTQVTLPDGLGASYFSNLSQVWLGINEGEDYQPMGTHLINVTDAAGGWWSYSFTDGLTVRLDEYQQLIYPITLDVTQQNIPTMVMYKTMTVTTPESGTMVAKFEPTAGMALASWQDVCSGSDAATQFVYSDTFDFANRVPWLSGTLAAQWPVQNWGDPTAQINALSGTKTFHYATDTAVKDWRIMDAVTDENGHLTTYNINDLGLRTTEKIYANASGTGTPAQETDFGYSSSAFPGIMTSKTVKKLSGDPSWATDLVTSYTLDGTNGNVLTETVGSGSTASVTSYTYDANNNKLTTTDPNSHTTTFAYDNVGHLITTVFPSVTTFSGTSFTGTTVTASGTKSIGYDYRGNKIRETDENGNSTLWAYDGLNRVIKEARDLNGNGVIDSGTTDIVTQTTYTPLNAKATVVSPTSGTTAMEYDGLNRLTQTTDALSNVTTLTYGANSGGLQFGKDFQPTKVTDARGFVTLTTYDKNYRPIQKDSQYNWSGTARTPVYSTVKWEYDGVGNVLKEYDPLSTTLVPIYTEKAYDALNRETSTTFQDGSMTHAKYTTTGLKYEVDDELTHDTLMDYDDHGRLMKVSSPLVDNGSGTNARAITQTTYDLASNVVAVKNPLNYSTTYTFDARNRKASETRPGTGSPTFYTKYDKVGNVTKTTDALGNDTVTQYDVANRPIKLTLPEVAISGSGTAHPVTTKVYDLSGNITKITDPNNHDTLNVYDKLNRLTSTTQVFPGSDSITVNNEYDEAGNRTAVVDGEGHRTEFTYDGLKRLTYLNFITSGYTEYTSYFYDAANLTSRNTADGMVASYGYDLRHRLTSTSYSGHADDYQTRAYDAAGNLLTVSEPAVSKAGKCDVAYTYDWLKRVVTETSGGLTHVYKYDLAGNRIYAAYGGISSGATGWYLGSAYDEQNRLTTLSQVSTGTFAALATTYTYDLNGNNLAKTLPNGDTETSVYDALNRTISLTSASGTNTLCGYAYEYDAASNVAKVSETYGNTALNRTVTNTYDQANRITREAIAGSGTSTTTYAYDKANNRAERIKDGITTTYSYNDVNQLVQIVTGTDVTDYVYAPRGIVEEITTSAGNKEFSYDVEGRVSSMGDDVTSKFYSFRYDYRSRRVERATAGITTKYIFSGGVSVREFDNAVPSVDYVRGSDWGGGVGGILYSLRSGIPSFTHYDRRGDVTTKTDLSGTVTYQATYEAYGKRVTETGATLDQQKSNTKDEDIPGYANEGFRFRDLETGVFLSRDPAGFVNGPNLYTYVGENPWTRFDPEGLFWQEIFDVAAGGAKGFTEANLASSPSTRPSGGGSGYYKAGLAMGHGAALIQGASEMMGGGNMALAGAAVATGGAGVTATGVGAPVGAPAAAIGAGAAVVGTAVAVHGGVVGLNAGGLLGQDLKDAASSSPGGNTAKNDKANAQLEANKAQGKAFEKQTEADLKKTDENVQSQLSIKTNGTDTTVKVDHVSTDSTTGAMKLTESKSSATAPLTPNQKVGYPDLQQNGGVVLGNGKPGYSGGTVVPPTKVNIVRPDPKP